MTDKARRSIDEEKTAAASYIIQFYQEVAQLKHTYAQYLNLLIELESATNTEKPSMNQVQKNTINTGVQTVRYYIIQTNITCQNILTHLKKEKESEKLDKLYQAAISQYMIKRKDLQLYVQYISQLLMEQAMRGLLQSSKDIIKDLYDDG